MLKLNKSGRLRNTLLDKHLNTSYVEVKQNMKIIKATEMKNLNTSYVEVKRKIMEKFEIGEYDLNTSYVEVKL